MQPLMTPDAWPKLDLDDWQPTYRLLHRVSQMVGKVSVGLCAPLPHWWHTSLRFAPRGLRTLLMPASGAQIEIGFDFIDHVLRMESTLGKRVELPLESASVAEYYARFQQALLDMDVEVQLWPVPVEVPDPIPFAEDDAHLEYDRQAAQRMWTILLRVHQAFRRFQSSFVGKSSPVHFFWGAFDVAVTRFSGRPNPEAPTDPVMGPAYSHEVISHGFWFGGDWPTGGRFAEPVFYAYAVPTPQGLAEAEIEPAQAHYSETLGEFLLPYNAVRTSEDPFGMVDAFMRSTYDVACRLADWDHGSLKL